MVFSTGTKSGDCGQFNVNFRYWSGTSRSPVNYGVFEKSESDFKKSAFKYVHNYVKIIRMK